MSGVRAAALWMTGAILSFSVMAIAGRELSDILDTFEIMTWRSLTGLAIVVAVGAWTGRLGQAGTARPGLHLARNVSHFAGQNLWFYAVATIPLAQVFALEFTTPIWVALAAPFVLGERLTATRIAAAGLGFLGVLAVARPGVSPLELGHLTALLAAFGFAGSVLATRALAATEPVWRILLWMTATQAVMGALCMAADGAVTWPPAALWPLLALVGVAGLTAHLCVTSALAAAPAIVVAPMDFLRLPLIAVVGALAYGEPLEIAVFAGAALVLCGNLLNLRAGRRVPVPDGAAR